MGISSQHRYSILHQRNEYQGLTMKYVITAECLLCDGLAYYIGTLGRLEWFQCENCGIQFNYLIEESTIEEQDNA
jgi:hypothetical protein